MNEALGGNLMTHEPQVRLACFALVLVAMGLWEQLAPRRRRHFARGTRWLSNVGLALIATICVRLAVPVAAVGAAVSAQHHGFGLLNVLEVPAWLGFIVAVVLLDCAIYWQHRLFHRIAWLWHLHRVHHADKELDVTTGIRFHPIEIVLSAFIKVVIVGALGAPAAAVVVFEILLNATSMFNHANIALPTRVDRALRKVLVTPDMHRVHHSVHMHETDSNFGFNLPWWDYLFGTYIAQPRDGHDAMRLGLTQFRDPADQRLGALLLQPLRRDG